MEIYDLDYGQRIKLVENLESEEFIKIPGTSPNFRDSLLKRKDRKSVRDIVSFLWNYAIDSYIGKVAINKKMGNFREYEVINILALSRSSWLYENAKDYLESNINENKPLKIYGRRFYLNSLSSKFKYLTTKHSIRLRLTQKKILVNPTPIDLTMVPWEFIEGMIQNREKRELLAGKLI